MQKDNAKDNKKMFHFDNLYINAPREYELITLYQIGDLSGQPKYEVGYHPQYCYEISYIESGKGYFYIDDEEYKVEKGDIFVNLPGKTHRIKADDIEPLRFFYMGFDFNHKNSNESPFLHIAKKLDEMKCPVKKDRLGIETPFLCLLKELRNVSGYTQLMVKGYINEIIILMYRNFFSDWENKYDYEEQLPSKKDIVYNLINYIDNNILNIKKLSDISKNIGYSYSYLSHVFREETGLTLHSYYTQKRLQKASELLKSGEKSITRIAEMLDYESIHSFSKAFKRSVGISPSEYQKLHG